ncbi:MAG: ABC transporter ATP-binding protein [Chloroflexota bacterium]|nr:ABC transporter ATP-binding protein [Chloroflexota bacterium]
METSNSNKITDPKITISELRVLFLGRRGESVEALGGVSLNVADGELACIVGPSGCGKTTLLRVLAGLEVPTGGSATIRGDDPLRPDKAMVFQGAGLFPWMTVEQNVAYGLQVAGMRKAERLEVAHRWITEIGLERFARVYPAQLSGGMKQRVGLARAFATDPEVLLMDEPFGALDAQTRLILQQTLLEQWERNHKTVVFVTHSIEEALTLGDKVYMMSARPGRLLAQIDVPFSRPRDAVALRTDPRFSALFAEVWEVLRDEVDRARVAELEGAV